MSRVQVPSFTLEDQGPRPDSRAGALSRVRPRRPWSSPGRRRGAASSRPAPALSGPGTRVEAGSVRAGTGARYPRRGPVAPGAGGPCRRRPVVVAGVPGRSVNGNGSAPRPRRRCRPADAGAKVSRALRARVVLANPLGVPGAGRRPRRTPTPRRGACVRGPRSRRGGAFPRVRGESACEGPSSSPRPRIGRVDDPREPGASRRVPGRRPIRGTAARVRGAAVGSPPPDWRCGRRRADRA